MAGALVLIATPIGNLGDLPPRAVEALAGADVIACEDTRRTGKLLRYAGVEGVPLLRVDDHTEAGAVNGLLERIRRGERVAVVTDAGTPGISDPGERLVQAAVESDVAIEVVPGPSAVIAALVVSGLPTGRFVFEGFLPRRGLARTDRLAALAAESRTIVFYEAPHRIERTLVDLAGALGGGRRVAVARELTKLHEEVWRGRLADAAAMLASSTVKGEYVVVVEGAPPPREPTDDEIAAVLAEVLAGGASTRDAAAEVAERLGVSRRWAYQLALAQR